MPIDPPEDPGGFDPGEGEDGAASPTALLPDWILTRDGVEVDPVALGIFFGDLVACSTQGDATLTFSGFGGAAGGLPDYWLGHQVALYADWGSGWTLLFSGRVAGWGTVYDLQHGWGKAYTAKGPSYLASRVPMTSWIDGGTSSSTTATQRTPHSTTPAGPGAVSAGSCARSSTARPTPPD